MENLESGWLKAMNLVYLYIHSFRSIRKKSFNFDSNYRFSMKDGELRLLSCRLQRKVDWDAFFKGREKKSSETSGRIANVSAIIGENGSGKTTLAFVLQQLVLGRPVIGACLAVFTEKADEEKEFYVCKVDAEGCEFRIERNLIGRVREGPFIPWRAMLYYSPLYSTQHVIHGDGVRVFDASATATMKAAKNVAIRDGSRDVMAMTQADNYDIAEMRSILEVQQSPLVPFLRKKEMFGLCVAPSVYTMSMYLQGGTVFSKSEMNEISRKMLFANPMKISEMPIPWQNVAFGRLVGWARKRDSYVLAFVLMSIGWMRSAREGKHPEGEMEAYVDLANRAYELLREYYNPLTMSMRSLADTGLHDRIVQFVKEIAKSHASKTMDDYNPDPLHGVAAAAEAVFIFLKSLSPELLPPDEYGTQKFVYKLKGDAISSDEMAGFLRCARGSTLEMPYLDVSIDPPLSSGEACYYLMYARLMESLTLIRRLGDNEIRNHVLLYLDECETALHPERQRELVSNIVKFCSLTAFDVDVQVVIATHSPLLLSDIPGGNVCIMRNEDDERSHKTFGANIFDLYHSDFGVLSGQLGVFARETIERLLKKANEGKPFNHFEETIVEMVGDQLVRSFLKRHMADMRHRWDSREVRGRDYLPEL